MNTPGITVEPLHLLGEHDINAIFYDDVRVPADNLVGGENKGWSLITNQLNHERVTLCSPGIARARPRRGAGMGAGRPSCADGRRVIDQEWVQLNLARVHAGLEFLRLINWKVAWTATRAPRRRPTPRPSRSSAPSSTSRRSGSSWRSLGPRAYLQRELAGARPARPARDELPQPVILTFGGGTNEIQRDLIAMFGLGLPRSAR